MGKFVNIGHFKSSTKLISLLLFLIVCFSLLLRLNGINWDGGNFFHPDERSILMRVDCMYRVLAELPGYLSCLKESPGQHSGIPSLIIFLDPVKSPLNPHWFPLGGFILYLLLAIRVGLSPFITIDLESLSIMGRLLGSLADTGSVILIFILAKYLFGKNWGLLAATLLGLSVIHVQLAHFYRPEPFLVLFLLASFWQIFALANNLRYRNTLLLGGFIGLAFATKITVLPILLPVFMLYIYHYINSKSTQIGFTRNKNQGLKDIICHGGIFFGVTASIFVLWNPYAVLSFGEFLDWLSREGEIVRTAGLVPYTTQYLGTSPFLYQIRQVTIWGLGLPLGILCWIGIVVAIIRNIEKPKLLQILMLLWFIPFFLIIGFFETKFLRYMFPLIPFLILFGVGFMRDSYYWLRGKSFNKVVVIGGIFICVLVPAIAYSLSFQAIYRTSHPAVQASEWINRNVSHGTVIITDNHWDEGIPNLAQYDVRQFPAYEQDSLEKIEKLSTDLSQAQHLFFYSNRTYGSIMKAQERYPLTSNYYQLLMDGHLGYKLTEAFTAYPELMNLVIVNDTFTSAGLSFPEGSVGVQGKHQLNLGFADENVTNYDHPLVMIFTNKEGLGKDQIFRKISFVSEQPSALLIDKSQLPKYRESGGWVATFGSHDVGEVKAVLLWLLLVHIVILGTLPLTCWLFRSLPDHGIGLSGPLGLLAIGYLVWISTSISSIPFSRATILTAVAVVCASSMVVVWNYRRKLIEILRSHWRHMTAVELLFLFVFFTFLWIRMANPDLWHPYRGGEKPMDLAYLTAIVKSISMPPYDPWFSDGYINYYYFGHFLIAMLVKMTRIVPSIAYNLATPLLFSMAVLAAFSIVYNLSEIVRRHRFPSSNKLGPYFAGLMGVFLTFVIGNQGGAEQLLKSTWDLIANDVAFPIFDFWASSRVMSGPASITEFPFWTFLFGDLHAHLIAIPFYLLTLLVVINLVFLKQPSRLTLAATILCLSLTLGAQSAINTWDLPAFATITFFGIGAFQYNNRTSRNIFWLMKWGILSGVTFGLAWFLYLPFHFGYQPYPVGLNLSSFQTPLADYLIIHFPFVLFGATYFFMVLVKCRPKMKARSTLGLKRLFERSYLQKFDLTFYVLVAIVVLIGCLAGYPTLGFLMTALGIALLAIVRSIRQEAFMIHSVTIAIALLSMALVLGVVPELITIAGDIDRMNTVFKLYLQAWVLYGLSAGFIIWYLAATNFYGRLIKRRIVGSCWITVISIALIAGLVFPVLGTRSRLQDRFQILPLTLNGEAYTDSAIYRGEKEEIDLGYDMEAIRWLRENVVGSPVVLEAAIPHQYRWGSRVSTYTGLPTVVGWIWHQKQQRGLDRYLVDQRQRHVEFIYSTTDSDLAFDLIKKYDVEFIYVGQLERLYYNEDGLKKFADTTQLWHQLVYSNAEVQIYKVLT